MRDPVALEMARMLAQQNAAERRIAQMVMTGKVGLVDADKRMLRLKLGTNSKGEDVLGPWVRWQEAGVGALSIHSEPEEGEQMLLISMSGTIGAGSIALPASFDQDHAAPSTESDTTAMKRATGRFHLSAPGGFLLEGPVTIDGDFQARNGTFRHNSKNVGDNHKHVSAPPGDPGEPL